MRSSHARKVAAPNKAKLIDRAVDHQSKQALSIVIEHASDNFCQALSDAVAEQIVDLIERPAQQAEERLV